MLKKESLVYVSDGSNVRWVKIFHLYKGFFRKSTEEGFFIKGSAKIVEAPKIYYKGFKYRYKIKGDILRSIIVRVNMKKSKKDSTTLIIRNNSSIIINKKFNIVSKYTLGPISKIIKRKKLLTIFKIVI